MPLAAARTPIDARDPRDDHPDPTLPIGPRLRVDGALPQMLLAPRRRTVVARARVDEMLDRLQPTLAGGLFGVFNFGLLLASNKVFNIGKYA